MIKEPLVSVIIPTYKDRGGLLRAVNSVIAQTYRNLEIIVVDDNNPDDVWRKDTENVVAGIKDIRLKYIQHPINKNGAAARNTGIKNAKGEYIAFLDDDDYFFPKKIEKQVTHLIENPAYEGVYCQGERNKKLIAKDLKEGNLSAEILSLNSYMFTPSLLFKKEVLNILNGFDETFIRHQDYEILLRFFKQGFRIGAVQEVLFGIGTNNGENIPRASKLEELKEYFFERFADYIQEIEKSKKGFRKKVFIKHYSAVFLAYLKEKDLKNSLRIANSLIRQSPMLFMKTLYRTALIHLRRKCLVK